MNIVDQVRRFNASFPWHQIKPSLAKRASKWLQLPPGLRDYAYIAGDLRMQLDLTDHYEWMIYFNIFEMQMLSLIRRILRPGDAFIDGGANIGLLTMVAAQRVGTHGSVFAFEPFEQALHRLRHNLDLNRLSQVQIFPQACWHTTGHAPLYEFDDGGTILPSMGQRGDRHVVREWSIPTVRIDDIIKSPVRLIKLDIEGAEWSALQGAEALLLQKPSPHLLIELNPTTCASFGHDALQVVDWITQRVPNYRMYWVKSRRHYPVDRRQLTDLLRKHPNKSNNVWFEPVA